jgi:Lysophospholipase L1 and related esterases
MRKNIKSLIIVGSFTAAIAGVYYNYSGAIINVLGQNTISNTVKSNIQAAETPEINIYENTKTATPAPTVLKTPADVSPLPDKSDIKPPNRVISGNVVLLGDSMTEGLSIYGYLPETHIVGVNSLNTISALDQVDKVVSYNPDKLFILLGINDIWEGGSIDEYIDRYKNLITEIKKRTNCAIYIESLLPVSQYAIDRNSQISNEIIDNANSKIENMTEELNIKYIDVNSGLKDEKGNLRSEYSNDGVHLINIYYPLWTDKLITYMG